MYHTSMLLQYTVIPYTGINVYCSCYLLSNYNCHEIRVCNYVLMLSDLEEITTVVQKYDNMHYPNVIKTESILILENVML